MYHEPSVLPGFEYLCDLTFIQIFYFALAFDGLLHHQQLNTELSLILHGLQETCVHPPYLLSKECFDIVTADRAKSCTAHFWCAFDLKAFLRVWAFAICNMPPVKMPR